jgi:regulator of protease activity HflC (stomatin/prohibitin superfamily)
LAPLEPLTGADLDQAPSTSGIAAVNEAERRLILPLLGYGLAAGAFAAALSAVHRLPQAGAAALRLRAISAELLQSGLGGAVLASLLLGFCGLAACAAITASRGYALTHPPGVPSLGRPAGRWRRRLGRLRPAPMRPGRMARVGQGLLVPLLAGLAVAAAWGLRPGAAWTGLPTPNDAYLIGAALLGLTFPLLVAERAVAGWPARLLPEAAALRCLLLLPVLACGIGGLVAIARGLGFAWPAWIAGALDIGLAAIGTELALRALARWFLPAPADAKASAAVESILAMLAAGIAAPGGADGLSPLRSHFGLDFSRSWALTYLRRATVPAVVLTALFCWGLSGVRLVPLDQRGIYESYGAPVAVFGPGLHLGLPWPLGRVRPVELGVVHAIALGGTVGTMPAGMTGYEADPMPLPEPVTPTGAEDPPGPQDDRLWTGTHPAEAEYLIASTSRQDDTTRQGFQIISADLRVLWRVGTSDADARAAAYAAADPDALVRAEASRIVARFFAVRTLDDLLAERRETMANELRDALARQVAAAQAGIEILAVVVEAVHPPAGAADAYHAVQAAEIESRTSISTERGRAHGTDSLAHESARTQVDTAQGNAAETAQGARADATRFAADSRANAVAGRAFLIERYFADLSGALAKSPLTIIDDRLGPQDAPTIDLRPPPALTLPSAGPGDPD